MVFLMEIEKQSSTIEIKYTRARFFQRVMANLIDILVLILLTLSCFLISRSIYNSTNEYKTMMNNINTAKIESGLFMDSAYKSISEIENYLANENKVVPNDMKNVKDTVSILNDDKNYGVEAKIRGAKAVINCFFKYASNIIENETYDSMIQNRNEYFLKEDFVYIQNENKIPYFLLNERNEIIQNEECPLTQIEYYKIAYRPYIDTNLQGYLASKIPAYYQSIKKLSSTLFFIELPICAISAFIITYFIPPLIFKRGRMTIGKAIYRIGLVNSNCLNPSFKVFFLRFLMLFFLEFILSIFTFGLPILISFSMMAFSKKRQSFIDYMFNLQEISVRGTKIFYSLDEIRINDLSKYHDPVNFNVRNQDW